MGKRNQDLFFSILIWTAVLSVVGVFCWILFDLVRYGWPQLSLAFLFDDPANSGRAGGIRSILVSTLLILGVCMVTAVPLGLGTAVFLSEFTKAGHRGGKYIRRSLDVLAGVPSIVFGLFGNAFFCQMLGLGFSIVSGGLTLACMVLPIFIRAAEESLRSVPLSYRFGAEALGMSKTKTLWVIILPWALPGLVVGFVLGVGRAIAETAALIFTSGYVDRLPSSLMDSGRSLSVHIYDLAMNVPGGNANASAAALVLVALLLTINFVANTIADRFFRKRILLV